MNQIGIKKVLTVSAVMVASVVSLSACSQGSTSDIDAKKVTEQEVAWKTDTDKAKEAMMHHDFATAQKLFKQAFRDALELGQDHPAVARSMTNLADFYYVQGDGQQADKMYRRAMQLKEKTLGAESQEMTVDLIGLGALYFKEGKYNDALPLFQHALTIRQKVIGTDSPLVVEASAAVARTDLKLKNYADAAKYYKLSVDSIDKQKLVPQPGMLDDYAQALRGTNNTAEAQKVEARAKEIAAKAKKTS